MKTSVFLAKVQEERAVLDSLLAKLDAGQMVQPTLPGGWSVKDVLAHIAWFEDEMTHLITQRTLAGSDLWRLPGDERNAVIHQQNQGKPLAEVLTYSRKSYSRFLAALQTLSDEDLNDPASFRDMPSEWVPWQLLADNSSNHYAHHGADIRMGLPVSPD